MKLRARKLAADPRCEWRGQHCEGKAVAANCTGFVATPSDAVNASS
jgi:hypothetical protein